MQGTVAEVSNSKSYIMDDHVHLLFEQFKDTTFERILLMSFARDYDLAQVVLNNALPKGQRHFAEGDVREFIARFNKQAMQLNFFVAKNAIISTGRPALALADYETALHNLLREFTRRLGALLEPVAAGTAATDSPEHDTPASVPVAPPPRLPSPQEVPPSVGQLLLDPLWSVIFALPVLCGWIGHIQPWPLLGMALCSSATFTVAHGKHGWRGYSLFCGLGNLLSLAAILPIVLSDWQMVHFPALPYGAELPPWVNAGLWGLICSMSVHLLVNCWFLITRKPAKTIKPGAGD